MKIDLGLIIEDKSWKKCDFINKKYLKNIIHLTLSSIEAFQNIKIVEIVLLLTDNNKMQNLNNQFLQKNKPTNVLSFPDNTITYQELLDFLINKDYIYIGDIALGYEIVNSEANQTNISLQDHFTHLLIHGVLHLIGYDHIKNIDAQKMMDLEIAILSKIGIKSPYNF